MNDFEWVLKLKQEGILVEGIKDSKTSLHLHTPCKIHLTNNAVKLLGNIYEANIEKGGVLVAIPKRIDAYFGT